jgi:hypothetical protein
MTSNEIVSAAIDASRELATHPQSAKHLDVIERYLRGWVATERVAYPTVRETSRGPGSGRVGAQDPKADPSTE